MAFLREKNSGVSNAGYHSEGNASAGKRVVDVKNTDFDFHWQQKKQPSPGAMAFAWETLALQPLSPIDHGVAIRKGFSPLAFSPQLYVKMPSVPTAGYGGLQTGQMIMQSLIDPYTQAVG